MLKVGGVDIDTSHPLEFAKIMKKSGRASCTCIYNAGFRSDTYVEQFMRDNDVSARFNNLQEMAKHVDVAFIHSCNWDRHLDLAQPFIDAGKPVFIDKPIVGNYSDCCKLEELAKTGACAFYQLCTGIWRPTVIVVTTTKGTFTIQPEVEKLYEALLMRTFDFIENSALAANADELIESIKVALAGKISRENHSKEILLKDIESYNVAYDGDDFEAYYAKLCG